MIIREAMTGHSISVLDCLCPAVASASDLLLSPQKGAQQPPTFRPMSIVAKRRPSQLLLSTCKLLHLHLAPPLGVVTPFEFCRDVRQQKTRLPGLSCGIVCMILRLAVSVEHRLVTDGRADGRTDA